MSGVIGIIVVLLLPGMVMAQAMVEAGRNQSCFILRISTEAEAGMLRMEIQDNGPGMTREVRKRIFKPFLPPTPPGAAPD